MIYNIYWVYGVQNNFSRLKKLIISAMFLALAIIIGQCKIIIPGLFRVVFNGPFYKFIAIIFGPSYGLVIGFLSEIIGVLINYSGNYIFLFSITAALRNFLVGLIWFILSKKNKSHKNNFLKLIICVGLPDYFISFVNTLIYKSYFIWPIKTFFANLALRLTKESIMIIINIFILNIMLGIYKKVIDK